MLALQCEMAGEGSHYCCTEVNGKSQEKGLNNNTLIHISYF